MKTLEYRIARLFFFVPLALFSIYSIFLGSFMFSFLNQDIATPTDQQLTVLNYLLPMILTKGFIIYQALVNPNKKRKTKKNKWLKISLIVVGAIIAIPWQIVHIQWQYQKSDYFLNLLPYLVGFLMTLWTIVDLRFQR